MAADETKQEQRTFLRERFLRFLTSIQKLPAQFSLVNGNTVSATFGSSDVDVLHIQVNDLENALLRSTDITSITTEIPHPLAKDDNGS